MNITLLNRILAQPWAVRRATLSLFTQLVMGQETPALRVPRAQKHAGQWWAAAEDASGMRQALAIPPSYVPMNHDAAMACANGAVPDLAPGVVCIMAWGILGRAWSALEKWWLNAVEVDELSAAIAATPPGSKVVLWFRSPGGIITGIPETAAQLRALGAQREIIGFTDDLCASAAYWLAAQCSSIVATPTADVGSIGVYLAFYDFCAMLEKAGVKLELFKAGTMKGTGMMGKPLTEEERAYLQQGVLESYAAFTADVTMNRAVADEFMQGQTLRGDRAKAANLVDRFTASAADFFASL